MYTVNSLRDPSYFNHSIALCSRHVCVMHNQTRTVPALLFHTQKQFMAYFSVAVFVVMARLENTPLLTIACSAKQ
jgi:hypothetical protein